MGETLLSDDLIPRAPDVASRSISRVPLDAVPGLLAVGALGMLILAACLLAIGFCFIDG